MKSLDYKVCYLHRHRSDDKTEIEQTENLARFTVEHNTNEILKSLKLIKEINDIKGKKEPYLDYLYNVFNHIYEGNENLVDNSGDNHMM